MPTEYFIGTGKYQYGVIWCIIIPFP